MIREYESVCDEAGNRHFTDEDAVIVGTFPIPEVEPVIARILKLNRMGADDEKKAPSTTTPNSSSPSESAKPSAG